MEHNAKSVGITVGILALLVGGGAGYAIGMGGDDSSSDSSSSQSSSAPAVDTKAADLRALLNNLESEHVDLAAAATRQGFNTGNLEDPQFVAAAGALGQNTDDISAAIASVYGDEAGAQFKEIWASHIGFFVDYTVGAKTADQAKMDKAVADLNGYVEAISTFLSGANPNLPKDAVASLVSEHVGLLKTAVDKHGAGDDDQPDHDSEPGGPAKLAFSNWHSETRMEPVSASAPPTRGAVQNTIWPSKIPVATAGPSERAGFIEPPVRGPATSAPIATAVPMRSAPSACWTVGPWPARRRCPTWWPGTSPSAATWPAPTAPSRRGRGTAGAGS